MNSNNSNILYVAAYKEIENVKNPIRKVGITGGGKSNEISRMKTLSNGTEAYAEIIAIQAWKLPESLPAKDLESHLHSQLDILNLRTNREWFNGGDDDDHNIIEELVEEKIRFLRSIGLVIKALHESKNDSEKSIISEDEGKIKIRGNRTPIPNFVKINGNPIVFTSFVDILKETFKQLIDSNKILPDKIPHSKGNSKKYLISDFPLNENESNFLGPFEYKGLFLETHGSAKTMIDNSKYLIDQFGEGDFIIKVE